MVTDRNPKEVFVEKLSDTYIDWQMYACMLIDLMVEAEIREKDFCKDSRWWYNHIKELDKNLTNDQRIYFDEVYEAWMERDDK